MLRAFESILKNTLKITYCFTETKDYKTFENLAWKARNSRKTGELHSQ
jgi:hypothetical protein